MATRVLGPAVAGSWYSSDPADLRRDLERCLMAGRPSAEDAVIAVIAPHAGYIYSGATAGAAFGALRGASPSRVLLLGPSHHAPFAGAAIPAADAYRTPLGDVPLDTDALARLAAAPGFRVNDGPFGPEHSLEMEIPFLQAVLVPGFRLVPILVGPATGPDDAAAVAAGLRPLLGPSTLAVVSSDFTHYGRRFGYVPFRDRVPERIRELDHGAILRIAAGDADGLRAFLDETGATVCGRHAIDVLLRLLPRGVRVETAAYDTSGRITGEWDHSVSYASLVLRNARP